MTRGALGYTRTGPDGSCCCCKTWCETCGIRKCKPTQCHNWAPGTLNTEYIAQYPEKKGMRGERTIFDRYVDGLGKFDGRTTNRVDFTPKRANNLGRRAKDSAMPQQPFDGATMYQTSYVPKAANPDKPAKKPWDDYHVPFDGTTTNRADFTDKGLGPRPDPRKQDKAFTLPFNGSTTYRSDFIKKQRIPNDPRDKDRMLQSLNLDNHATYATDFIPKRFPRVRAKICCDDRRHAAMCETHRTTQCCERPWTACSSCVGH